MKTPTTREILEAMHAKAPAPKSVLFERVKEAREAGKRLGLVERIKAGARSPRTRPRHTLPRPGDGST